MKLRGPKDLLRLEVRGLQTSDLAILSGSFKRKNIKVFSLNTIKHDNTLTASPHSMFLKNNPTVVAINFQRQKPNLDREAGY